MSNGGRTILEATTQHGYEKIRTFPHTQTHEFQYRLGYVEYVNFSILRCSHATMTIIVNQRTFRPYGMAEFENCTLRYTCKYVDVRDEGEYERGRRTFGAIHRACNTMPLAKPHLTTKRDLWLGCTFPFGQGGATVCFDCITHHVQPCSAAARCASKRHGSLHASPLPSQPVHNPVDPLQRHSTLPVPTIGSFVRV